MTTRRQVAELRLPDLAYNAFLCRYAEIGLKGRNRAMFERAMVANTARLMGEIPGVAVRRERGRVFLRPPRPEVTFDPNAVATMRRQTAKCFGLVSTSPAFLVAPDLAAMESAIDGSFGAVYDAYVRHLGEGMPIPYAMRARRSHQNFPMTSREIEIHFAERLLTRYPALVVDLEHPLLRVEVEVRRERAFISYERCPGPGGLPAGTAGRVLALLSGGIDSPVACYLAMRRGCIVDFVTFHSAPYTPPATLEKVARVARVLREYQGGGELFAVNLADVQREIRDRCTERFRTVLYRRLMMRVSERIARRQGALALLTGDSLGQVASQTLGNLAVVSAATTLPIFRPLIGAEKQEAVDLARRIGTLAISEEQVPDSCTVFAPRSPVTNAPPTQVEAQERRLPPAAELVARALASAVRIDLDSLHEEPVVIAPETTGRDES